MVGPVSDATNDTQDADDLWALLADKFAEDAYDSVKGFVRTYVMHRQLLAEVWGPTHEGDTHYLRIYMKQLRDKLEANPVRPKHLITETGVGYRLVAGDSPRE